MKEQVYPTIEVIKYNWEVLKTYTKNNPIKMLEFFDNVYIKKAENYLYLNPWAASVLSKSTHKPNYIQGVTDLITNSSNSTNSELFVYLDLCSMRSYFTFINTKGKANYLPIWKVVNKYNVDELLMNRLLTLDDNYIYMIYEGEN